MLIERVDNPMIQGCKENIVNITMTVDQFHHLSDCVSIAYQEAKHNSRMFLIVEMIYDDFRHLKDVFQKKEE